MAIQDPISDLLTRVRNAQQAKHQSVLVPDAKVKRAIIKVLIEEGFIMDAQPEVVENRSYMRIFLKYHEGTGVIDLIKRVSRPGLRIYRGKDELPKVRSGLGCAIVSTAKGVMTDAKARAIGQGGEVLFIVA
ncbi:MAG: 30S ribosomal protein S8 [Legionellales bacterium]|jgi:small subunit ribosomal protein S8